MRTPTRPVWAPGGGGPYHGGWGGGLGNRGPGSYIEAKEVLLRDLAVERSVIEALPGSRDVRRSLIEIFHRGLAKSSVATK